MEYMHGVLEVCSRLVQSARVGEKEGVRWEGVYRRTDAQRSHSSMSLCMVAFFAEKAAKQQKKIHGEQTHARTIYWG